MKRYDMIMAATLFLWLFIAAGIFYFLTGESGKEDMNYKVEINQIMTKIVNRPESAISIQNWEDQAAQIDLGGLQYVKAVRFLPAEITTEQYAGTAGTKTEVSWHTE